jgi:hypothetical protein
MAGRVLILTRTNDDHADHVADLLARRDAEVLVFDPGRFPTQAGLSVSVTADGTARQTLAVDGREMTLDGLSAVWFRRPNEPAPHQDLTDEAARVYVQDECATFAADVWDQLECRAVPAPRTVTWRATRKARQLIEAGRLGFEVPPTLVTTDPDEFLDFYAAHDGRIITKAFGQLSAHHMDEDFGRFTELVGTRDVGFAAGLRRCPIIAQPYVPKAVELRVTVVGSRLFAAEIHSQESNRARIDWRRHDLRMTPHRVHHLPDTTAELCLALVRRLGLCYGAIDLIHTPDGRYLFLEINPSGQYLWIEQATGLPISAALCDVLLGLDVAPPSPPYRLEADDDDATRSAARGRP